MSQSDVPPEEHRRSDLPQGAGVQGAAAMAQLRIIEYFQVISIIFYKYSFKVNYTFPANNYFHGLIS